MMVPSDSASLVSGKDGPMISETPSRLARLVQRIEHDLPTPPADDRLMTTPEGADRGETSLSRDQVDLELRKGCMHRHYGES
jgi:hypothetical protein